MQFWNKMVQWASAHDNEKGAVDIGGVLMMGIGMVFLAVGFIIFPIITTSTDTLLAYEYSSNTSITDATFTGFTAVIGITRFDLGAMLLLRISIIFIAIALIIRPVTLDGIAAVVHGSGTGISASYTGLSAILLVTPLLVLISFLSGAVISGYFGIRRMGG